MTDEPQAEVVRLVTLTDDARRHAALKALADEWWDPPAELVDTLPARGGVELRYLSHAWVRKALQDHDPDWYWEPMGYDSQGQPVLERDSNGNPVGFWIWLHVLGTRRAGYGSVEPGKRDAIKELIGDALRNAAQPVCGGALWTKSKPEKQSTARRAPAKGKTPKAQPEPAEKADRALEHIREQVDPPEPVPHHELSAGKEAYDRLVAEHGEETVNGALATFGIARFSELTPEKLAVLTASLNQRARLVREQEGRDAGRAKE